MSYRFIFAIQSRKVTTETLCCCCFCFGSSFRGEKKNAPPEWNSQSWSITNVKFHTGTNNFQQAKVPPTSAVVLWNVTIGLSIGGNQLGLWVMFVYFVWVWNLFSVNLLFLPVFKFFTYLSQNTLSNNPKIQRRMTSHHAVATRCWPCNLIWIPKWVEKNRNKILRASGRVRFQKQTNSLNQITCWYVRIFAIIIPLLGKIFWICCNYYFFGFFFVIIVLSLILVRNIKNT